MPHSKPETSLYLTPYLVTVTADVLSMSQTEEIIFQQLEEKPSPAQITLINEEKKSITIDMIRSLRADMSYASLHGKKRHVVLLCVEQTTIEAQNAVLKLLEEPPKNTQFWLVTQTPQVLLPTIISRCQEISVDSSIATQETAAGTETDPNKIAQFIKSLHILSYRELIEKAEEYPDKTTAQQCVNDIIRILHKEQSLAPQPTHYAALTQLLQTKHYLAANVSPKLVLEHCFFLLKNMFS